MSGDTPTAEHDVDGLYRLMADVHTRSVVLYLAHTLEETGSVPDRDGVVAYLQETFEMPHSQAMVKAHHTILPALDDYGVVAYTQSDATLDVVNERLLSRARAAEDALTDAFGPDRARAGAGE